MKYRSLIITGTRASGKTSLCNKIIEQDERFEKVKAVTTRNPRTNDKPNDYEYINEEEFERLKSDNKLLVSSSYKNNGETNKYGIKQDLFDDIIRNKKIPILVITPESAYEKFIRNKKINDHHLTIFLDASDEILDKRLKKRDELEIIDEDIKKSREEDRINSNKFLYNIENRELDTTTNLVIKLFDSGDQGGILPAQIIELMIGCGLLVKKENPKNIEGASYDLSLGDEYFYGGKIHKLSDKDPLHMIEPYDYAIVTSHEIANLPRDVSARFDLSVSLFCQGIILSNGPQVDPGFEGPLFCLLFNTSNSPVILKRRQHYATIEFQKLLEPTTAYKGEYKDKTLIDYLPHNATQGAINELKKEIEKLRKESQKLQNYTWSILSIILALIALWVSLSAG